MSLGAGYDTTFFWLQDQIANGELPAELKDRIVYVEVDYYDVTEKKIHIIKKTEAFTKHLNNMED